jgi:hypothetical protein
VAETFKEFFVNVAKDIGKDIVHNRFTNDRFCDFQIFYRNTIFASGFVDINFIYLFFCK